MPIGQGDRFVRVDAEGDRENRFLYAVALTMGGSIAFIGASVGAVAFPRVAGTVIGANATAGSTATWR
jgi:hypothetical protein